MSITQQALTFFGQHLSFTLLAIVLVIHGLYAAYSRHGRSRIHTLTARLADQSVPDIDNLNTLYTCVANRSNGTISVAATATGIALISWLSRLLLTQTSEAEDTLGKLAISIGEGLIPAAVWVTLLVATVSAFANLADARAAFLLSRRVNKSLRNHERSSA